MRCLLFIQETVYVLCSSKLLPKRNRAVEKQFDLRRNAFWTGMIPVDTTRIGSFRSAGLTRRIGKPIFIFRLVKFIYKKKKIPDDIQGGLKFKRLAAFPT